MGNTAKRRATYARMTDLGRPKGAYRAPDRDRERELKLLEAFEAEIALQRAHDRHRIRRARYVGLIVSGLCAALFAVAMAQNLVKEGLTANGLRPLLACAVVVIGLTLLVRRARLVLRHRADLSRQKLEMDMAERVAERVRAATRATEGDVSTRVAAESPLEPFGAEDERELLSGGPRP